MENKKFNIDQLNKDLPFKVPEGYFDSLPDIISSRIESEPSEPKIKRRTLWGSQLALAATLIGFVFIAYSIVSLLNSGTTENLVASDTAFVESEFLDEANIVDALTTTDTLTEKNIESEDIINYLVDNDINEDLIVEFYQ